jgi:hypothetical protein
LERFDIQYGAKDIKKIKKNQRKKINLVKRKNLGCSNRKSKVLIQMPILYGIKVLREITFGKSQSLK